jgi:hypothetical protein
LDFPKSRAPLKDNRQILSSNPARLRIVAQLLLGLMMHALFIVTTHHHPIKVAEVKSSTPVVSQDSHTPEEHLPQSSDDFHCAACSLHRGLDSQHAAPLTTFQLVLPAASRETVHCEPHTSGAFLSLTDRAPPTA